MSNTYLWLVRHAETEWNAEGRMQGHTDSPLTEAGVVHARAVARRLMNAAPDVIYSSDLGRAVRTADEIAAATEANLRLDTMLREKNNGIFEGLTEAEVEQQHPEIFARYQQRDPNYAVPDGESTHQVQRRAVVTMERLARAHPEQKLVVVSHGGFLSAFIRYLLDVPLSGTWRFRLENCSITTVHFNHDAAEPWRLLTLNDIAHLKEKRPKLTLRLRDIR